MSVSKEQFKKEIVAFFEQKMKIKEAKKQITENMKKDEYNNSISCSNVRLFYCKNKNYAEGGTGWYLTNGKHTVKL